MDGVRAGRGSVLAATLALGASAWGATNANAASVVLMPAAPAAGQSAVLQGSGFHGRVVARLGGARATVVRASARGRIDTTVRVPARAGRRALVVRSRSRRIAVLVQVASRGSTTAAPSALAALSNGARFVLQSTRGIAGDRITLTASGLRRRTRLTASLGGMLAGTARASARGRATLTLAVPQVGVGVRTLTLRARGVVLRLRFTVLASAASSPAPAPPPAPAPAPGPGPSPGPPGPNSPALVAAAGDIACSPSDGSFNGGAGTAVQCRQAATADTVAGLKPDAVLALGDTQYFTGAASEYAASYAPTWGRFDSVVRPVPGDAEYGTSGASGYFGYFGARAGDPGRGYYSFDLGAWHIIALNSQCAVVACASGSTQERWLRADLAAHPGGCTLAFWHKPRYSSGPAGQATQTIPFWDDLYAAGAEIVLGGDNHEYERFAPQTSAGVADPTRGVRQFVVGTGGEEHQPFTALRPNREAFNDDTFGVLALTLRPGGYDWRFVPEAGKSYTDGGSASCH
jgi:hypothetical protein